MPLSPDICGDSAQGGPGHPPAPGVPPRAPTHHQRHQLLLQPAGRRAALQHRAGGTPPAPSPSPSPASPLPHRAAGRRGSRLSTFAGGRAGHGGGVGVLRGHGGSGTLRLRLTGAGRRSCSLPPSRPRSAQDPDPAEALPVRGAPRCGARVRAGALRCGAGMPGALRREGLVPVRCRTLSGVTRSRCSGLSSAAPGLSGPTRSDPVPAALALRLKVPNVRPLRQSGRGSVRAGQSPLAGDAATTVTPCGR